MIFEMVRVRVIHVDPIAARFLILLAEDGQVVYSHWRPFQKAGYAKVDVNYGFVVCFGKDERDRETLIVEEVVAKCEPPDWRSSIGGVYGVGGKKICVSESDLRSIINGSQNLFIISDAEIEKFDCEGFECFGSVLFLNCTVSDDFRIVKGKIRGGLWFLNCQFRKHFSLKGTILGESVFVFGCDFSGPGGVSFRQLRANSVFIDYGVQGGDDMVWLNEMSLKGSLVVNGSFRAPVQILSKQDGDSLSFCPKLGSLYIGKRSYHAEQLSGNCFGGGVVVEGYRISEGVFVFDCIFKLLSFVNVFAGSILVNRCEINKDLLFEDAIVGDESLGVSVLDCIVGRHLKITGNSLPCLFDLSGSSVGEDWRLELRKPEDGIPKVTMNRFHASQAWFEPISILYGNDSVKKWMSPPQFGLLQLSHVSVLDKEGRRDLAESYTKLKNWLSNSGHLREEDYAFFHMRSCKEESRFYSFVLGFVFGWGIRFRNVLSSVVIIVLLFSVIYSFFGFSLSQSFVLSVQSMISSFFGRWPDVEVDGAISAFVTVQSLIGVLFVTVLVGAYIRKLLR